MTKAQDPWAAIRALVLTAALCAVLLLVVRPLLVALTNRYARHSGARLGAPRARCRPHLRQQHITDKIGVHDIFGGFLAGLVLPRGTVLLRPVTGQLGALNRALLLPVFFVSIGLQVNMWYAVARPAVLIGGAVLLLVAIVGKFGGTAVVASAAACPASPRSGWAP